MDVLERRSRPLAFALFALAAGLGLNSILGPLVAGVIDYRYSESLVNQAIGLDAVALFGAVPLALVAGWMVLRWHRAGPLLAFIPSTFAVYMIPQYLVGPEYLDLPGNNERFILFHLSLFVLAVAVVLLAWGRARAAVLIPETGRTDRWRIGAMFGVAGFVLLRWIPAIIELTGGAPTLPDYLENPTAFLLIGLLDLGLVVPAALTAGLALARGVEWSRKAVYAVIGWFALVPTAVAAMAVTMQAKGDPNADPSTTTIFVVAAVVFTAGAALLYWPVFRRSPSVAHLPEELPTASTAADHHPEVSVGR